MIVNLLPSEIARLILSYLEDENLKTTYDTFLNECKYLEECRAYLKRGIVVPKKIHGKSLSEYLIIDINSEGDGTASKAEKMTQTDVITMSQSQASGSKTIDSNEKHITNLKTEPTIELNDDNTFATPLSFTQNMNDVDQSSSSPNKRKRLLIGKNVEKQPMLSISSLERQLVSIINDAAEHLKEDEILESQNKQQQFIYETNRNNINAGNNFNSNANDIIFLSVDNGLTAIQSVTHQNTVNQNNKASVPAKKFTNSDQLKQIKPKIIPIPKSSTDTRNEMNNLKNALAINDPPILIDDDEDKKKKRKKYSTSQNSSNPNEDSSLSFDNTNSMLNENTSSNRNDVVCLKKKRVYKRVTPTIRNIYANELTKPSEIQPVVVHVQSLPMQSTIVVQQNLPITNTQNPGSANTSFKELESLLNHGNNNNTNISNQKDSIDVFDLSFTNSSVNVNKNANATSPEEEDELDMWLKNIQPSNPANHKSQAKNVKQNSVKSPVGDSGNTRTLRSRTASQRKIV